MTYKRRSGTQCFCCMCWICWTNEYWYLLLNRSSPPNRWSTNRRSDTTRSGVTILQAPIHFHDNRFCSSSSQLIVEYIVIENHWKVWLTFYLHIIQYHHILLQYRVHLATSPLRHNNFNSYSAFSLNPSIVRRTNE